jgi:hypothetical protein
VTNTATGPLRTSSEDELAGIKVMDQLVDQTTAVSSGSGKRSGPKTAAGKRAVSQNATTHGITSLSPVAGGEDAAEWEEFKKGWHD